MNPQYLLFDVGGTDIKAAFSDAAGTLHGIRRIRTQRVATDPAHALVEQLKTLGAELMADFPESKPIAVGLLVCGIVDEANGTGVFSANLGWRDAPLRQLVADAFALPVGFGHDVLGAGVAELRFGAGKELGNAVDNAAVLIIGTGIAAALFVDGRPLSAGGYAGELGHGAVPGGLSCPCGAHGCLETIGSAGAIAKRYEQKAGVHVAGAREVLNARDAGDQIAVRIWDEAIAALTFSIAQLCCSIAPQVVIIGGGLAQAGEALLQPLREALGQKLTYQRLPELVAAQLGQDAGLRGAHLKAVAAGAPST